MSYSFCTEGFGVPTLALLNLEELTIILEMFLVLLKFWCAYKSPEELVKIKITEPYPKTCYRAGLEWNREFHF